MISKIGPEGQATIPQEVLDALNLKPGDKVKFFFQPDGSAIMLPVLPVSALKGFLAGKTKKRATLKQLEDAAADGAVADFLSHNGH